MKNFKDYVKEIQEISEDIDINALEKAQRIIEECRENGGTIYPIGNGDDAILAERVVLDWRAAGFKTVSLFGLGVFTATANDYGWSKVFSDQLSELLKPEDVIVALSSSGNSENVIRGIETAWKVGSRVIAISGGGRMYDNYKSLAPTEREGYAFILIPDGSVEQIEDLQGIIIHYVKLKEI